jgi:BioY family
LQLVATKKVTRIPRVRRKSVAGQGVLVLLGLQVLFFSSFIAFDLPTATGQNLTRWAQAQANDLIADIPPSVKLKIDKVVPIPDIPLPTKAIRMSVYSPQAPCAIFMGYALGWPIATIAAGIFILIGLVGPYFGLNPFASGGGLDYYAQPGFGYLLGILAATFVVAKITGEKRTSFRQVAALVAGLFTVHAWSALSDEFGFDFLRHRGSLSSRVASVGLRASQKFELGFIALRCSILVGIDWSWLSNSLPG